MIAQLQGYAAYDPLEREFQQQFLWLLQQPECFSRHHFQPGHITASAWVVNPSRTNTLLINHTKLNRWLQPGGHADGNADVREVALRELAEETGCEPLFVSPQFIDLDVHRIPARKSDPPHDHFDFRFLVEVDEHRPVVGNHESTEVRWIPLAELEQFNADESMLRLRAKTRLLSP